MEERQSQDSTPRVDPQVARTILFAFLLTFIAARVVVLLIMLVESFHYVQRVLTPRLYQLETNAPNRQPAPNSP